MTDEISIQLPGIEQVEEILKYTDCSAPDEIAILQPVNLRATPSIIAANGLMPGCRSVDMRILIAAVEAIAGPLYDLEQLCYTGATIPFIANKWPGYKKIGNSIWH